MSVYKKKIEDHEKSTKIASKTFNTAGMLNKVN